MNWISEEQKYFDDSDTTILKMSVKWADKMKIIGKISNRTTID